MQFSRMVRIEPLGPESVNVRLELCKRFPALLQETVPIVDRCHSLNAAGLVR